PADLGRMGATTGDRVRVSSSRRSLVLDVAADAGVLRGSAVLAFNAPGEGAAELIDVTQPVTDVRIETVGPSGREREAVGPSGREREAVGPSGREREAQ
ncbi:MAG: hypothetical protein M3326_11720, partial [Actinomycetota bacterium]|nr:hypothetical protein [Actinomycetota bacterium]